MRMIKTFTERVTEKFIGTSWQIQPSADPPFEDQVNTWANDTGFEIHSVATHEDSDSGLMGDIRIRTFRYCVLYDTRPVEAARGDATRLAQLDSGDFIPEVEVTMIEDGVSRKALAMGGACGVPRGFKLGSEDTEPAPPPLFSPDLELSKFATLFRRSSDGRETARSA